MSGFRDFTPTPVTLLGLLLVAAAAVLGVCS
jgi:hypothetical protein